MAFRDRFPRAAALLAGASTAALVSPAGADADEGDDANAGAPAPKGVDAAALQAAFSDDAGKLVAAERTRWATVLDAPEAQGNLSLASHLLGSTDMAADAVVTALKKAGPGAKTPATREGDDADAGADAGQPRGRETSASARKRLQGADSVRGSTGGAGAKDRSTAGASDELDERRERRSALQDRRNAAVTGKAGRTGGAVRASADR